MEYVMHTREDAPQDARASLGRVAEKYGFVPNLAATMAQAPELLRAYVEVEAAFRASALAPVEQEVVALTVSARNRCRYCMSGHSMLATMSGMEAGDLAALRDGRPLPTERLEALRAFTLALLDARGLVPEESRRTFLAAGFTREQALSVPLGIAFKTLSNLTHHLQPVPLDPPLAAFDWEPASGDGSTRVLVTGWLRNDGHEALAAYQAAAGPVMSRYGGRPLVKARPASAHLGSPPDVAVLMEFPSPQAAHAAFRDAEYATLASIRDRAFSRIDVASLG